MFRVGIKYGRSGDAGRRSDQAARMSLLSRREKPLGGRIKSGEVKRLIRVFWTAAKARRGPTHNGGRAGMAPLRHGLKMIRPPKMGCGFSSKHYQVFWPRANDSASGNARVQRHQTPRLLNGEAEQIDIG